MPCNPRRLFTCSRKKTQTTKNRPRKTEMAKLELLVTLALLATGPSSTEKQEEGSCDVTAKSAQKANDKNIKSILGTCGQVCQTDLKYERKFLSTTSRGRYYKALEKKFDCEDLWDNPIYDEPSRFCVPPDRIPKKWLHDFTYGGRVDLKTYFFRESQDYYPEFQVW